MFKCAKKEEWLLFWFVKILMWKTFQNVKHFRFMREN